MSAMNRSVSRLSRHEPEPEWSYMANTPVGGTQTPLDSHTRNPPYRTTSAARSGRRWKWKTSVFYDPITAIAALLVAGVLFAIGHHSYYSSLNKERIPDAQAPSRAVMAGILLALLSKFCLLAALGMARVEVVWSSFSRRSFSVEAIDGVFESTSNLLRLTKPEVLGRAKMATLLAVIYW